jgi:cellulose synthase/poly-beta-1,6-N-acetylglucosamine synthase-like glycosyltransferase
MNTYILEVLFWISIAVVFYAFIGYGFVLFILVKLKRLFCKPKNNFDADSYEPSVTLFVTAYNEKDYIKEKVANSLSLEYPREKVQFLWITDGSDDGTPELLREYPELEVQHKPERNGKIAGMNRGVDFVKNEIIIFCDANTILNKEAIREITRLFADPKVGCVSGEKRVLSDSSDSAAGSGEGFYWKYESKLKKWDSELYSVVGAAGELFAIRTEYFTHVPGNVLLDDFIISLRIAMQGKVTKYTDKAYAMELPSANVKEELKRKIRIAAGGIQSIIMLLPLLNIFKYKTLSFQYISHRVLRWTVTPFLMILAFILSIIITINTDDYQTLQLYSLLLFAQIAFYFSAIVGWILENKKIKLKIFFIPYYFFIMNYAVIMGIRRYLKGKQSVNWERAKRSS